MFYRGKKNNKICFSKKPFSKRYIRKTGGRLIFGSIYTHTHTHTYTYIHTHLCTYIHIYAHTHSIILVSNLVFLYYFCITERHYCSSYFTYMNENELILVNIFNQFLFFIFSMFILVQIWAILLCFFVFPFFLKVLFLFLYFIYLFYYYYFCFVLLF